MLWGACELDGHFMHTLYRRSVGAVWPLHFYQTFGRRAVDALKKSEASLLIFRCAGVAFIILTSVNLLFTLKKHD